MTLGSLIGALLASAFSENPSIGTSNNSAAMAYVLFIGRLVAFFGRASDFLLIIKHMAWRYYIGTRSTVY